MAAKTSADQRLDKIDFGIKILAGVLSVAGLGLTLFMMYFVGPKLSAIEEHTKQVAELSTLPDRFSSFEGRMAKANDRVDAMMDRTAQLAGIARQLDNLGSLPDRLSKSEESLRSTIADIEKAKVAADSITKFRDDIADIDKRLSQATNSLATQERTLATLVASQNETLKAVSSATTQLRTVTRQPGIVVVHSKLGKWTSRKEMDGGERFDFLLSDATKFINGENSQAAFVLRAELAPNESAFTSVVEAVVNAERQLVVQIWTSDPAALEKATLAANVYLTRGLVAN